MSSSPAPRLLELGLEWYRKGHLEESTELFEAARQCAETLNEPHVAAEAWVHYARATFLAGDPMLAEHGMARAAEIFDELGAHERATDARVRGAFVAYDAGDLDRATRLLEVELERAPDPSVVRGMALGYLGNIARSQNDLAMAHRRYELAIETLAALNEDLYQGVFEMDLAISRLLSKEFEAAWRHLERSRALAVRTSGDPLLSALITHYESLALTGLGESKLAQARLESFVVMPSVVTDALVETHALVRALNSSSRSARWEEMLSELRRNLPAFEHARLTLRILRGLLGGETEESRRIVVFEHQHRLRVGHDLEIDFGSDSAEWKIANALLGHRQAAGSDALSAEALIEAGWPGERLSAESAKNRLHVALSKLRKRGLRDLLLRYPEGYALSPGLTVLRLQSDKA